MMAKRRQKKVAKKTKVVVPEIPEKLWRNFACDISYGVPVSMTLRQWYKGVAVKIAYVTEIDEGGAVVSPKALAYNAGQIADAMLAEDAKHKKKIERERKKNGNDKR